MSDLGVGFDALDDDGKRLSGTSRTSSARGSTVRRRTRRNVGGGKFAHAAQTVVGAAEDVADDAERVVGEAVGSFGHGAGRVESTMAETDQTLAAAARTETATQTGDVHATAKGAPPPIIPGAYENPLDMVPPYAVREEFKDTEDGRYGPGFAFRWMDEYGRQVRIHGHQRDTHAPVGTIARDSPIYRVEVDRTFLDVEGRAYDRRAFRRGRAGYVPEAADLTHIPWPAHIPFPGGAS